MDANLGQERIERDGVSRLRRPADGHRALRDALGCFATGVAVVTGRTAEGAPFGLTINSFSSVSLDPPLIAWSLRSQSPLLRCFPPGVAFTVNVLGAGQETVARQFSAPRPDRFTGIRWHHGPGGLPHLDGAIAWFDCRLTASHRAGDHRLLIGGVEQFAAVQGEPLLFVQGAFRTF